eukprot:TRINITY_DN5589_c0_g1_i1.p1 TRINITY_DN5589_c0_g1~~TRINITY_DN5589_c0_g1_i1.p1  ORF type:complete len:264 (-),score=65.62 TRINITY_DN5589_c0_g1_i1:57-848(-)
MEFVKSKRGSDHIKFQGYVYRLDSKNLKSSRWRCAFHGCKGRIKAEPNPKVGDIPIILSSDHDHVSKKNSNQVVRRTHQDFPNTSLANIPNWIRNHGGEGIWDYKEGHNIISCRLCHQNFHAYDNAFARHALTKNHRNALREKNRMNATASSSNSQFTSDLAKLLSLCGVSPHKAEHPYFIQFFNTYTHRRVPSRVKLAQAMASPEGSDIFNPIDPLEENSPEDEYLLDEVCLELDHGLEDEYLIEEDGDDFGEHSLYFENSG